MCEQHKSPRFLVIIPQTLPYQCYLRDGIQNIDGRPTAIGVKAAPHFRVSIGCITPVVEKQRQPMHALTSGLSTA
jgi:hypothetical protein